MISQALRRHLWLCPALVVWMGGVSALHGAQDKSREWPKEVGGQLEKYCYDCHDSETAKGDVRLDNLVELPLEARLDLLNRIQEKVYFEEMPPKKKTQPSDTERKQL